MATAAVLPDVEQVNRYQGHAADERKRKRLKVLKEAQYRGDMKAATALNLSPFDLELGSGGLIQYKLPKCPLDKQFSVTVIPPENTITFPKYTGNQEMSDKSVQARFDVGTITPIQQLMEFKQAYYADGGLEGMRQGGIVVFEGAYPKLTKDLVVRVPYYLQDGRDRFLAFEEGLLGDLITEADNQMRLKFLNVVQECNTWKDQGGEKAKNIQRREHTIADYCVRRKWLTESPAWRHTHVRIEDQCKRCGEQYKSRTGVCKCSFVMEPFLAFMSGEIASDHVRMQTLTKEEWVKVNAELKRRAEAQK